MPWIDPKPNTAWMMSNADWKKFGDDIRKSLKRNYAVVKQVWEDTYKVAGDLKGDKPTLPTEKEITKMTAQLLQVAGR